MKIARRNKVSAEFNMSSMTDIVFLLLIFFMITSTMVTTNALDLVLPKAKGKTDSNKATSVAINKDLKFFIDKTPINENEVESKLLAIYGNVEEKKLIIRAEEGVPIEKVVYIMDIANRNNIKTSLAVNPK